MAGWRSVAMGVGAAAAGVAVGYAAERAVLRSRLRVGPPGTVAIGSLAGDERDLLGPDGTRLMVETYGPPSGSGAPQVVLSHGWCNTNRVWHHQVEALAGDTRLITYDQPGHGRSSSPVSGTYSIDFLGDTLAVVLEQATDPGPVVLVGHSLGGMTVMNLARRHPELFADRVAGVLLLSTTSSALAKDLVLGFGVQLGARLESGLQRLIGIAGPQRAAAVAHNGYRASSDASFLLTRMIGLNRNADPRHVDFVEQMVLDADAAMLVGLSTHVLRLADDDALLCLTCPTVIAVGTEDLVTPPTLSRRMAERCPHAELVELAGAGHMLPLEAHDAVTTLLRRLVARTLRKVTT